MARLALIGYGKMGQAIEKLALNSGHEVVARIDDPDDPTWDQVSPSSVDVAIEFTQPGVAFENLSRLIDLNIKVISGTTGWLERKEELRVKVERQNGTCLHASNFSLGVNLFFQLAEWLTNKTGESFEISMEETHHTEKKDAPSGTAIRISEAITHAHPKLNGWVDGPVGQDDKIPIVSHRKPNVPGTHVVSYTSAHETITIEHCAHDRNLFAQGALDVALWIIDQHGWLTMEDFIKGK